MERHLNKSKYGCPANRFSGGAGNISGDIDESDLSNGHDGPVSLVQASHVPGHPSPVVTTVQGAPAVVTATLPREPAALVLLPHVSGSSH